MELYGCFIPAPLLFPLACLGLGAQCSVYRDLLYPAQYKALEGGEEGVEGWAGLSDELLAAVFLRLTVATPGLLLRWPGSCQLRFVCRSWRRVHDSRCVLFIKPAAFRPELIASRFPALRSLDLSRCKYPDEIGMRELLASLRQLESLTLKDTGVGPRLAATLAEGLVATGRLRVLNLSSNGVGKGASCFAAALRLHSCPLEVLNLRDNMLTAAGAAELGDALRANRSLRELDLSANPAIGCEGAVALSAALVRNDSLRVLNLGGCGLGDDGACALAQSLSGARGLRSLSLYSNAIGDAGARELAAGAARCDLEALELRGNARIGAAGVRALAEAAAASPRLRAVYVDAGAPCSPARPAAAQTVTAEQAAAAEELRLASGQLSAALRRAD